MALKKRIFSEFWSIVLTPPPLSADKGRGGLTGFSKRGGLSVSQSLVEGVVGKEGVTFFRGVAVFT